MTRIGTAVRLGTTELRRTPLLLALLIVGPAYVIYVFTFVAPDGSALVHVGGETVRTTLPKAFPAFTTPMTAAVVSGITGLFLMQTAAAADARALVAGYRSHEIIVARLTILGLVALVASAVSIGIMLTAFQPEQLGWFVTATMLAALSYGMVGVLVGVLLDRLVGVYLILFGSMIDLFVFQNPLATDPPSIAQWLPGHYPLQLTMRAGFTEEIALGIVVVSLGYLVCLTILAILGFHREMKIS